MGLLDGKVALITGAGGGLGEAYAKLFAREGAAVVVNDLGGPRDGSGSDKSMADKVVDAIKAEGGRAVANGADISTMAGGQSVFDDAIKHFGRADILVNNAGILLDETFQAFNGAGYDFQSLMDSASTISTSAGSRRRSTSSRVTTISPGSANRTRKPPVIRLRSWACIGWPNSSIT